MIRRKKFKSLFSMTVLSAVSFVTPAINSERVSASGIVGEYDCNFDGDGNPTGAKYIIEDDSGVIKLHSGSYCYGEILIPNGVEEISVNAFSGSGIEKVVIPSSVSVIHENAFYGISSLSTVQFSNGDVEIGKSAFLGCSSLSTINLMSGKKDIGETAFYNSGLTSINFGNGIESIGNSAFVGTNLTSVTFPRSLKTIGASAFSAITSLGSIQFGGFEESIGSSAFNATSITSLQLPSTLGAISANAFRDNLQLISVKIPDGVITVGGYAFSGNYNLREVDFGNTIQKIEVQAFYAADLREVSFPNSLVEIESLAFSNNTNLRDVRLGNGLQTIRSAAFRTTDIRDIHIPSSVTTLEADAFIYTNLQNLSISESATGISQQAFTTVSEGNPQYNSNLHMCQLEQYLSWGEVQTALPSTFSTLIWVGRASTHVDSNGNTRLFFCGAPTAPKISTILASGPNSANVRVQQSLISGGSDVTAIRIETSDGSISQTFSNNGNATYTINGLKSATTYSFKAYSVNSKGVSSPSGVSISITTSNVVSEAESLALQREAERLRQIEITKKRTVVLNKLSTRQELTLEDLQKSDFAGVTMENFTIIQAKIAKSVMDQEPSLEIVQAVIKHVVIVGELSKVNETDRRMYASSLVEVGLIANSSKNKTQIFYQIKRAPVEFRKDEESLVKLITRIEAQIKVRNDRLAALRARSEARSAAA